LELKLQYLVVYNVFSNRITGWKGAVYLLPVGTWWCDRCRFGDARDERNKYELKGDG
jgi:hypothetical protein